VRDARESAFGSIILQKVSKCHAANFPLTLQEQLKPPNGGVFLGLNGIVIRSHGGSDAEVFADAIKLGYELVLQELHSEIKQTIASAVRRRGQKRRTLWRGVTTRLGQP
jgi:fatty acid/phospholipid biosynthesis enzyme